MIRTGVVAGCVLVAVAVASSGCGADSGSGKNKDPAADKAAVVEVLNQWPKDFDAKNAPAVCSLFAQDVVVSYPGTEDRSYDDICTQLQGVLTNTDRTFRYAAPKIREVLVDGDLATVQLIWTLTVTDSSGAVLETVREDGVDVFQRQSDGSWKIHISHAYPL